MAERTEGSCASSSSSSPQLRAHVYARMAGCHKAKAHTQGGERRRGQVGDGTPAGGPIGIETKRARTRWPQRSGLVVVVAGSAAGRRLSYRSALAAAAGRYFEPTKSGTHVSQQPPASRQAGLQVERQGCAWRLPSLPQPPPPASPRTPAPLLPALQCALRTSPRRSARLW